ncbi:hypothetical protein NBRC116188_19420 [Oceaniserpentilla sp. 4NH20-0058]|uniref:DUF2057 family protein n=1 Tax=Oceaniserpentilla sp. 4NH20-0058 TaxID=3127660 RepID=UPI003102591A
MRILFISVVLFLQACSTPKHLRLYDGPSIGVDNEVRFVLPLNFELISLDQQAVSQYQQVFRNHDLTIKLAPGQHTLVVRYSDIWDIDDETHEKVTSGHITFAGEFLAGQQYHFQTPTLNSYNQAKAFVKNPNITLNSQKNTLQSDYTAKANPLVFGNDEKLEQVNYPNLKQLQFWWANANQYEQKQFMQWVQSQQ